jgi:hypothetical protein
VKALLILADRLANAVAAGPEAAAVDLLVEERFQCLRQSREMFIVLMA